MNFLIDTNICSAFLKGDTKVLSKFEQFGNGSLISVITAGELWTWVQRGKVSDRSKNTIVDFINTIEVLNIDLDVALEFGRLRAVLLDKGNPMPDMDGLLAATALIHDLTLVTHNTVDFQNAPNLRLADWLD